MIEVPTVKDLEMFRLPAKELELVPEERNWARVVTLPVACKPLDNSREPEKELLPVLEETKRPEELKLPAVTELVTVKDLEIFNDPAKEEEPVPLTKRLPPILA